MNIMKTRKKLRKVQNNDWPSPMEGFPEMFSQSIMT